MPAPILSKDAPRFTVHLLLIALERNDTKNLKVLAKSILRSAFHHLYDAYGMEIPEVGEAMSTLIVARWEVEEAVYVG